MSKSLLIPGQIVTMETVGLHLSRPQYDTDGPDLNPDQSQWLDLTKFHVFYFTRIFYLFECPAYEQVGEWVIKVKSRYFTFRCIYDQLLVS